MSWFDSLINTFFLLGKSPFAPGTIGSLGALIVWLFIPQISFLAMSYIILCIIALSYFTILDHLSNTNEKDPQYIVIDEVIGMWIALLPLGLYNSDMGIVLLAFVLFRLFDIIKPSIVYRSQFLKGPLGILMDDIIAGIITSLIIFGIIS